jgi:hypothetical protein
MGCFRRDMYPSLLSPSSLLNPLLRGPRMMAVADSAFHNERVLPAPLLFRKINQVLKKLKLGDDTRNFVLPPKLSAALHPRCE